LTLLIINGIYHIVGRLRLDPYKIRKTFVASLRLPFRSVRRFLSSGIGWDRPVLLGFRRNKRTGGAEGAVSSCGGQRFCAALLSDGTKRACVQFAGCYERSPASRTSLPSQPGTHTLALKADGSVVLWGLITI
jgi:hypothetical protein